MKSYDAIILGAGGAGLMCAAIAGQRGRRVLLIDHADEPGKKILISGGGRCNFTNLEAPAERYLSSNRHFAKSALRRYGPQEFIDLVEQHNIAWHEKTLGQLFCDGSAKQIVAMLLDECAKGDVEIRLGNAVRRVGHADGIYRLTIGDQVVSGASLVIATGGPSIPKMGATRYAYDLARQFGVKIIEPRPALVPLTLGPDEALFRSLSGVATEVVAYCGKASFREAALFTHKGLSGPAILQVSSYWSPGQSIEIDFTPDQSPGWLVGCKTNLPRSMLPAALATVVPQRLAAALAERIDLKGELANITNQALTDAETKLSAWSFCPNGTQGFEKAEVTAGGIDTDDLSSKTMEAKNVRGLYVIGEAVDVTGWLGGYNFQWAWASGWAAGQAL